MSVKCQPWNQSLQGSLLAPTHKSHEEDRLFLSPFFFFCFSFSSILSPQFNLLLPQTIFLNEYSPLSLLFSSYPWTSPVTWLLWGSFMNFMSKVLIFSLNSVILEYYCSILDMAKLLLDGFVCRDGLFMINGDKLLNLP